MRLEYVVVGVTPLVLQDVPIYGQFRLGCEKFVRTSYTQHASDSILTWRCPCLDSPKEIWLAKEDRITEVISPGGPRAPVPKFKDLVGQHVVVNGLIHLVIESGPFLCNRALVPVNTNQQSIITVGLNDRPDGIVESLRYIQSDKQETVRISREEMYQNVR